MILQNGCNLNWLQPFLMLFVASAFRHWLLCWGPFLTAPFQRHNEGGAASLVAGYIPGFQIDPKFLLHFLP